MFNLFGSAMDEASYHTARQDQANQNECLVFGMNLQKDKYTYSTDHHLQHQERLIGHPNPTHFRFRQILTHQYLRAVPGSVFHTRGLMELMMIWLELIFRRFVEEAVVMEDQEQASSDLALKFMYECYSLKESIEIGIFKSEDSRKKQVKLNIMLSLADDVINQVIYRYWLDGWKIQLDSKQINLSIPFKYRRKDFNFSKEYPAFLEAVPTDKDSLLREIRQLIEKSKLYEKEYKMMTSQIFEMVQESKISIKQVGNKYDMVDTLKTLSVWVDKILSRNPKIIRTSAFANLLKTKHRIFDQFHLHSYLLEQNQPQATAEDPILWSLIQALIDVLGTEVYLQGGTGQRQYMICGVLRSVVYCNLNKALSIIQKHGLRVIEVIDKSQKGIKTLSIHLLLSCGVPAELVVYELPETISITSKRKSKMFNELESELFGPIMKFIIKCIERSERKYVCSLQPCGKLQTRDTNTEGRIRSAINDLKCPVGHSTFVMLNCSDLGYEICRRCCFSLCEIKTFFHCFRCSSSYCTRCYAVSQVSKIVETIPRALKKFNTLNETETLRMVFFHLNYSPASILMQAFLRHWSKYDFEGDILEVEISDEFDQEKQALVKSLQITRFPCFVLYNGKTPVKQITGASVYQVCEILKMLGNHDQLTLSMRKCLNGHSLQPKTSNCWAQWSCTQCKKHSKVNDRFLYCGRCPYFLCLDCSLTQSQASQDYHDLFGMSYLSSSRNYLQGTKQCSRNHAMSLVRSNPNFSPKYLCSHCQRPFYFNGEYGMWYCQECEQKMCHICSQLWPVEPEREEFASHHVVRTASNLRPCQICHQFMKWTYSSQNKNNREEEEWECSACYEKLPHERLHLVCLRCNIRVCSRLTCRKGYAMQNSPQIQKGLCRYCLKSPSGDLVKRLSLSTSEPYFSCSGCLSKLYKNTPHYQCLSCKNVRYCSDCKSSFLKERQKKLRLICMSESDGLMNLEQFEGEFDVGMTIKSLRKEIDRNQRCSMRILSNNMLERFDEDDKKVGDLDDDACICLFKSKRVQSCLPNTISGNIAASKIMRRRSTIRSNMTNRTASQGGESLFSVPDSRCSADSLNIQTASSIESKITIKSAPAKNEIEGYNTEGSFIRRKRMSISIIKQIHEIEEERQEGHREPIPQEIAESEKSEPIFMHRSPETASHDADSVIIDLDSLKENSLAEKKQQVLPKEPETPTTFQSSEHSHSSDHPHTNLVAHIRHAESLQVVPKD